LANTSTMRLVPLTQLTPMGFCKQGKREKEELQRQ
jgi:hypothetical protein